MGPAALGQTIAVVDRSGKVISTSKTLLSVFKEAKAAYREKKAEIVAGRRVDREGTQARRALEDFSFDDNGSRASSRGSRPNKSKSVSRGHRSDNPRLPTYSEAGGVRSSPRRLSGADLDDVNSRQDLPRRHTTRPDTQLLRRDVAPRSASFSDAHVDMDLAYGEVPPPLPMTPIQTEDDLRGLMAKVTGLLDEANCLQHSVSATISSLQRNPEALAAVALTLAEISSLAGKLAPGALTALKGSFPAVIALLASPQFMIAAGVGVGVVVVALGGYKIIKKIKARNAEKEEPMAELQEIGGDVNRIDAWRRGIPPSMEGESVGTSVEGEFITPEAVAMRLEEKQERDRDEVESRRSRSKDEKKKRDDKKKEKSRKKEGKALTATEKGSSRKSSSVKGDTRPKERKKTPSTLRLLFH
ncbi:MAG: hypothetical protein M4579_000414 [Chaenotheca gracillima]|nr:MAG: hypothetical protein M4579_000414 [Chaenotheca gracillima]